jgi:predicted nucleic acid-binding Zn ribbon protein
LGHRDFTIEDEDPEDEPDNRGEWEETYASASDGDDDDETVSCPYCGIAMWEESPLCPHCGNYLSQEDAPSRPKPIWIILTVVLLLLAWWLGIAAF